MDSDVATAGLLVINAITVSSLLVLQTMTILPHASMVLSCQQISGSLGTPWTSAHSILQYASIQHGMHKPHAVVCMILMQQLSANGFAFHHRPLHYDI